MMCKATLKLFEKTSLDFSSSSDSDDKEYEIRQKSTAKRRRKKKIKKKKIISCIKLKVKLSARHRLSNCTAFKPIFKKKIFKIKKYKDKTFESPIKSTSPKRCLSVLDFLPVNFGFGNTLYKTTKTTKIITSETKKTSNVTNQLNEVQARLFTLTNKIWFGVGNGDVPFTWRKGTYYKEYYSSSPMKKCKKTTKSKVSEAVIKEEKPQENKKVKESKAKETINFQRDQKKKKHNGLLKRQTAVDWSLNVSNLRIRKSKSLSDTSLYQNVWKEDEKPPAKMKKKKKRGKLDTKSKTFSLVKPPQ